MKAKIHPNYQKVVVKCTTCGHEFETGSVVKDLKVDNIALVLGSEGQWMSAEIKSMCDEFVYIKMNDSCESLNVGVAASILMYEVSYEWISMYW